MKPIVKRLQKLPADIYFKKHLSIIHQFLPAQLTTKEIEVLATFMSLTGDLVELDRFGTQSRKLVMNKLGIQPGGLGNYLKFLIEKGYIYKDDKQLKIKEFLLPDPNRQGYQFLIEKE